MSLISEALRKARQEAAEREAKAQRAAGGIVGEPRVQGGRFGIGLVLGAVIAVSAAMIGAGGVLWWLDRRADEQGGATVISGNPELETPAEAGAEPPEPDDSVVSGDPAAEGLSAPGAAPPRPGAAVGESGEVRDAPPATPNPGSLGAAGDTSSAAEVTPGGEDREFTAEAELGYATLTLDYIVFREHDPYAQINGLEVHVGAVVEGFKVLEVDRSSVRLEDDRGELVLRVR